jgi:hypothetical protein
MKKKAKTTPNRTNLDKPAPATLKDLLNPEIIIKLKAQADDMKAAEAAVKEKVRLEAEQAKKDEQKRLENDFEYLLKNSNMDWRKNK